MKSTKEQVFTCVIPARYSSTRFPGKPLAIIGGRTMIERVYNQAAQVIERVYVATDDERIFNAVTSFGGKAVMTSSSHRSGTDRIAEAAGKILENGMNHENVIINVQGDEPFILPEQIAALRDCFTDQSVEIATLVREVRPDEDLFNPNHPKVILSKNMDAIYFSRSVIPYVRDKEKNDWITSHRFYKHLGIYGYRASALASITKLPQSPLELAESLEQNRWIENGYRIRVAVTRWESLGIDTPEDLEKAAAFLLSKNK
ncbi:MAG TPA: 3-deoxy-manno-octulosonate cytidylyltransferase [Bacteroidales bacterium]|nr:3-deoxy-manno-octulosonate cytidylyltransferase [Bacteroidales bacterium]